MWICALLARPEEILHDSFLSVSPSCSITRKILIRTIECRGCGERIVDGIVLYMVVVIVMSMRIGGAPAVYRLLLVALDSYISNTHVVCSLQNLSSNPYCSNYYNNWNYIPEGTVYWAPCSRGSVIAPMANYSYVYAYGRGAGPSMCHGGYCFQDFKDLVLTLKTLTICRLTKRSSASPNSNWAHNLSLDA